MYTVIHSKEQERCLPQSFREAQHLKNSKIIIISGQHEKTVSRLAQNLLVTDSPYV